MSSPSVLAFAWHMYHFTRWNEPQIDQDRDDVNALIAELEGLEVVDLVPWCCGMYMLQYVQFWLEVEDMYWSLWSIWARDHILRYQPGAREVGGGSDDDEKKGPGFTRDTVRKRS